MSEFPCYECGATEMGRCGSVGCAAMRQQLIDKNAQIASLTEAAGIAASTLLMGIAFASVSREEFLNWKGHAEMAIEDLRSAGAFIHPADEIAARQ